MRHSFQATALWRFGGQMLGVVANLASLRLYGQYLGDGVLAIAMVVWQFMVWMPYFDGGYRLSVNRALLGTTNPQRRQELVRFAGDFTAWFTVAAFVVGVPGAWLYSLAPSAQSARLDATFFLMIGVTGGCSMWMWSLFGVLTGVGRQARVYQLGCLNHLLNLGALWAGFRAGLGPLAFPVSFLAGVMVCAPLAWWSIRAVEPSMPGYRLRWSPEFASNLRAFRASSTPALLFQVFALVLFSIDLPLVDLLTADRRATDAYAVSVRILTMLRLLLQSADEASWPLVAQDRRVAGELSHGLVRVNAWVYGAVLGPAVVILGPLLTAFSNGRYSPSQGLVLLLVARVLIVGLASQPSYFLHGDGRFRELARNLGVELLVGTVLAVALAGVLGAPGIALAFLLSTVGGSLLPTPIAYARVTGQPWSRLLTGMWCRALVSALAGGLVAQMCSTHLPAGWVYRAGAAAAGGIVALAGAMTWAHGRARRRDPGSLGTFAGWLRAA